MTNEKHGSFMATKLNKMQPVGASAVLHSLGVKHDCDVGYVTLNKTIDV